MLCVQVRLARDDRIRKEWERVLAATENLATLFEGLLKLFLTLSYQWQRKFPIKTLDRNE